MKRKSILFFMVLVGIHAMVNRIVAQDVCQPIGWTTQNGGTSGGSGASITVSNYNDLKTALTSASNKVVFVSGIITIPAGGRIIIQSLTGKTVVGLPGSKLISTDLTKDGSGILYIKESSNFIIRNLVFEGPGAYDIDGYDNLCIDNCQNFWVDHCEFHDGMDGNFDIKNKSDFISVTWCTFSYEKPPISGGSGGSDDHRYSNLIGSSDGATADEGKLSITFQYCWWAEGCRERMPRMRFGKLHMANNLFTSSVSNNCIRAGFKADILAEGNYFDNQAIPIDLYNNDFTAVKGINNYGASNVSQGTSFTPPYKITINAPAAIVSPIKNCAGAKLSGATFSSTCCIQTSINNEPKGEMNQPNAYPNPFAISTNISYTLDDATEISIKIFNMYGQIVYENYLGRQCQGKHEMEWNGKSNLSMDTPAGVYLVSLNGKNLIHKPVQIVKSTY